MIGGSFTEGRRAACSWLRRQPSRKMTSP